MRCEEAKPKGFASFALSPPAITMDASGACRRHLVGRGVRAYRPVMLQDPLPVTEAGLAHVHFRFAMIL